MTLVKWRALDGWPMYSFGDNGQVKRLVGWRCKKERILKPRKDGYITLAHERRHLRMRVGRFILFVFVGPPPSKRQNCARHLDDNIHNNKLENLQWGSDKENAADAKRNGRVGTDDYIARMSKAVSESYTAERRRRVGNFHLGRKRPKETSIKMKAAWARRRAQGGSMGGRKARSAAPEDNNG